MTTTRDYEVVRALEALPHVENLQACDEDCVQVLLAAQSYPVRPPILVETLEPLPDLTTGIINTKEVRNDPIYLAKLHDVVVIDQRMVLTKDGRLIVDLWNQGGLHHNPTTLYRKENGEHVFRAAISEPEYVDEPSGFLFFGSASGNNHSHWLIQTLPQLLFYEHAGVRPSKLVVQPNIKPYQMETLSVLGYRTDQLIRRPADRPIKFRQLYIGYVDGNLVPYTDIFDRLMAHFRNKEDGPKKVYVSRQDARDVRRFLNEELLIERVKKMGYTVVLPSQMTAEEEVTLFHDARIICGPLGAGLYNSLFTEPGAAIVALSDPNYAMGWLSQTAGLRGHTHGYAFGLAFESRENVYRGTHNNWIADMDAVGDLLSSLS